MNSSDLYLLLKIIEEKKNLNSLLRAGFTYKKIAEFAQQLVEEELAVFSEKGISLTENGKKRYEELKPLNKKTNKEEWIDKEISSKIDKLEPDFIYLPKQDELFF